MGPDYPFGRTAEDYDAELEEIEQEWGTFALAQKWMSSLDPETAEDPHEVEDFVGWMQSIGGPGDAVRWSTMDRDVDLRDVLSSIRVPTLVLHGLGDLEASIEHGRYLAQHIPGAELREMPGSTHMWSHSDDLPVEIERFLTTLHAEQVEFDRYLATVLFTDIVGSTEIVTAGGDAAWRDLVERHITSCEAHSPDTEARRWTLRATGSSRSSMARLVRSTAPWPSRMRFATSPSRSGRAYTRVRCR